MAKGRDLGFYIDHDVDYEVAKMLRRHGFEALAAFQVGLDSAKDPAQSAYARKHKFVLVTNDREFTARQRQAPLGQHIRIRGKAPDSAEILELHLDKVVQLLQTEKDVTVEVSRAKVTATFTEGSTSVL